MNIRQATVEDLEGMQNANLNNLPENYTLKYYLYHALSWPQASYVATTTTSSGQERVVGYVLAKLEDDAPDPNKPIQGHVTSVAVMRTYRRMGLAGKLMKQSLRGLRECYGAESVSLHVRKSNRAALQLYKETLQFEVLGIEKGYYADGEDAYSMKKILVSEEDIYDDDEDLLASAAAQSTSEIAV
uniref:ARAD1A17578p n=1 Tax=Blastobotrys adeninivorans TaxID=409370 RepID=A0A060SZ51_BLAAD